MVSQYHRQFIGSSCESISTACEKNIRRLQEIWIITIFLISVNSNWDRQLYFVIMMIELRIKKTIIEMNNFTLLECVIFWPIKSTGRLNWVKRNYSHSTIHSFPTISGISASIDRVRSRSKTAIANSNEWTETAIPIDDTATVSTQLEFTCDYYCKSDITRTSFMCSYSLYFNSVDVAKICDDWQ